MAAVAIAIGFSASGCAMLQPRLPAAQPAIQAQWPLPPNTTAASATAGVAADIGWRDFFKDSSLEELIARSLANNRDMRVAILAVERARELYRIQRSERVPSLDANAALIRTGGDAPTTETYSANLGITEFELDLFGRVNNLSEAALQRYFSQEETRRSTQLSLIAEVANIYLTLAADQEQARLANATLRTREEAYLLTQRRHEFGAVSALDVYQSRTQVETARADAARYAGQVAQDVNALNLVVGAPVEGALLPASFDDGVSGIDALPAGLPSDVLLRRPDVLQAEHLLRAANANIGAARAAFFPSIRLTGATGSVSTELSDLFSDGTLAWSFIPQISVPIFQGGRLQGESWRGDRRPRHRTGAV